MRATSSGAKIHSTWQEFFGVPQEAPGPPAPGAADAAPPHLAPSAAASGAAVPAVPGLSVMAKRFAPAGSSVQPWSP
ncbi:hypothetical protein GCM10010466_41680 [Planomonospora alba]|uniref:Uncharacterized protein n=1 Tax=Planomonospora alba TaxID=161354 RepID=A0ABP6NFB6_9ACTN